LRDVGNVRSSGRVIGTEPDGRGPSPFSFLSFPMYDLSLFLSSLSAFWRPRSRPSKRPVRETAATRRTGPFPPFPFREISFLPFFLSPAGGDPQQKTRDTSRKRISRGDYGFLPSSFSPLFSRSSLFSLFPLFHHVLVRWEEMKEKAKEPR